MPRLRIACLSGGQVAIDGRPIERWRSVNSAALLFYLAVELEHTHHRSQLAGLLWPDESETRARRNLNQILLHLRREIGDTGDQAPFLVANRRTITLPAQANLWVDVIAFEEHLARVGAHEHSDPARCETCTDLLQQAVDLYRAPFLDGFAFSGSDLYGNWVQATRERLHRRAVQAFLELSTAQVAQGELSSAEQVAQRLLDIAPWQEEGHRKLMLVLALQGQRSQALTQYDRCAQLLMDELGVTPSAATDALYDQILAGEVGAQAESAAPAPVGDLLPDPAPAPFQVPPVPAHFVGRDAECAQLSQGLKGTASPICALVGMGGVGKTTLAARLGHLLRADFADGVLWANTATSNPLDILAAWASAYGNDFSGLIDLDSRAAAVRGMLADRAVLIVLDNVLDAAAVRGLLPGGARNAVIFTTRDLDMAHALNAETVLLGELTPQSGRQMLAQIVGEERVGKEEEAAARIGARLHYLPLGMEIVAQRLKSRPRQRLAQMAARLADEEQRLGLEIGDRAVRASFAVSWQALDDPLQRCFALPAVFAGRAFSAGAIAYLAADDLDSIEDRLYALEALSLLRAEGEAHYRQHPLLADFAREKLGDADLVDARLVDYYAGFVGDNADDYARLRPEWANITAAIQVADRLQNWAQVIAFADALTGAWLTRARYAEARQAYASALKAAVQLEDEMAQTVTLLRWGQVCLLQSDYDEARRLLGRGLELAYHLEEGAEIADAYYHLARVAIESVHFDEARRALSQCLDIRRQLDDVVGIGAVYFQQARVFYAGGSEIEEAERVAREALAMQEKVADRRNMVSSLCLLAEIMIERRDFEIALSYAERARAVSRELQSQGDLAAATYTLTKVYRQLGDYASAHDAAERTLRLYRRQGDLRTEAMALHQISLIYKAEADFESALQPELSSLKMLRDLQDILGCAYALINLGDLYMGLGREEEGRKSWAEGRAIGAELNHARLLQMVDQREAI